MKYCIYTVKLGLQPNLIWELTRTDYFVHMMRKYNMLCKDNLMWVIFEAKGIYDETTLVIYFQDVARFMEDWLVEKGLSADLVVRSMRTPYE